LDLHERPLPTVRWIARRGTDRNHRVKLGKLDIGPASTGFQNFLWADPGLGIQLDAIDPVERGNGSGFYPMVYGGESTSVPAVHAIGG